MSRIVDKILAAFGRVPQDKLLHFVAGMLIVAVAALWHVFAPYAWTLGVLAGIGKEVYDQRSGGYADAWDFAATAAGAFVLQAAVWAYLLMW